MRKFSTVYFCKFENNKILQKYLLKKGYIWADGTTKPINIVHYQKYKIIGICVENKKLMYSPLEYFRKNYPNIKYIDFERVLKLKNITND